MAAGGAKATNATTTAAAGTTATNGSHGDRRDGSGWCNCDKCNDDGLDWRDGDWWCNCNDWRDGDGDRCVLWGFPTCTVVCHVRVCVCLAVTPTAQWCGGRHRWILDMRVRACLCVGVNALCACWPLCVGVCLVDRAA